MHREPPQQAVAWLVGIIGCLFSFGLGARGLLGRLFAWIPGDQGDAALNNWILERNLQYGLQGGNWLNIHALFTTNSFWPESNTLAWSDNWLVLTPVYAVLRLAASPGQAFALLIALSLAANVVACHRLCRHATSHGGYRLIAACLAGFSLTVLARLGHAQLMPAFAGVLAIDAALAALSRETATTLADPPSAPITLSPGSRAPLARLTIHADGVLTAVLWLLLQLAIGFYQGVFFTVASASLLTVVLIQPLVHRGMVLAIDWSGFSRSAQRAAWLVRALAAVLLLGLNGLIYRQYFLFSREVGRRSWDEVATMIPRIWSLGFNSLSHGGSVSLPAPIQWINASTHPGAFWEQSMFPGYTYALLLALGLWLGWCGRRSDGHRWPWPLSLLGQTCLLLLMVSLGIGWREQLFTAWAILYHWIPGFSALRAVSRIGLALVLLSAPILAWTLSELHRRLGRRHMAVVLALLLVLFLAGNVVRPGLARPGLPRPGLPRFGVRPYEARVQTVSRRVDRLVTRKNCRAFYLSASSDSLADTLDSQIMAMWASLKTGHPTASGYSGHSPGQGWTPRMDRQELKAWLRNEGLDEDELNSVCWIPGTRVLITAPQPGTANERQR